MILIIIPIDKQAPMMEVLHLNDDALYYSDESQRVTMETFVDLVRRAPGTHVQL